MYNEREFKNNGSIPHEKIHFQATTCPSCRSALIAEYNTTVESVTLFNFDPYLEDQKIFHRHQANHEVRERILQNIEVERRLLLNEDSKDFCYVIFGEDESN